MAANDVDCAGGVDHRRVLSSHSPRRAGRTARPGRTCGHEGDRPMASTANKNTHVAARAFARRAINTASPRCATGGPTQLARHTHTQSFFTHTHSRSSSTHTHTDTHIAQSSTHTRPGDTQTPENALAIEMHETTHTCAHNGTHAQTHTGVRAHARGRAHTQTRAHTDTFTTHTDTHTHANTQRQAHTHKHSRQESE